MREMIAGRITKTMKDEEGQPIQRSAAEIMAEAILDGMFGKRVITRGREEHDLTARGAVALRHLGLSRRHVRCPLVPGPHSPECPSARDHLSRTRVRQRAMAPRCPALEAIARRWHADSA